ncbi:serine/threonine-protein kinase 11-interacting protein isoform X2 [Drosophila willistoni]|uniref:serine/threonine-protein kinase 11-interacting protein isoform X2 n=1 Tax=Drosophila willistoni TaxID=7260 RepID=UPI00017D754F|nr:serine/threonine-protein kinase 11-interacting protein isoform X2 [Drosophila willistoni]
MDPEKITELANLLRKNGDKILSSEFTLTLSGSLLRALNDSFELIADSNIGAGASKAFQVVKPINATSNVFSDLQLLHDFVQKTTLLKLNYFPIDIYYEGIIDIGKFRALKRLEVHKISIRQVVGIQPLRSQLQQLICIKSIQSVDDIITHCGGDNSNGFVWNELQTADFSYNNLKSIDTALEFAQHLQHLNLRHNKLNSITAIKWLPHLKTLDLSYNCLTQLPQFHMAAWKRLQLLNISNNYVEELLDIAKMENLTNLDISDNCLLEHSQLLPLSAIMTLTTLNLQGNPLACHPKHRLATAQYLHKNTATVKFVLDFEPLSKSEKLTTGKQKLRFVGSLNHRLNASRSISINSSNNSINTLASSVGSQRSISIKGGRRDSSSESELAPSDNSQISIKKRSLKVRTVDISEPKEEHAEPSKSTEISEPAPLPSKSTAGNVQEAPDSSHLEAKKTIENLRLKYGNEWLQSGQAELMQSMELPHQPPSVEEIHDARQQFNEYLGDMCSDSTTNNEAETTVLNCSSTPTNTSTWNTTFEATLTPIKVESEGEKEANETLYETCNSSVETQYESINDNTIKEEENNSEKDKHKKLLDLYGTLPNAEEEEEAVSDSELDEDTYIVHHEQRPTDPLLLTISSNFIREKDALNERTKTKWSLQILESCEHLKANTLRLNFDTVKKDKQERIYCLDNLLCQELEKKLRDILSKRDLTEMNISVYRCVICGKQYMIDQKSRRHNAEALRCRDCHTYLVEVTNDLPSSMDKPTVELAAEPKLSPALIVEEDEQPSSSALVSMPLILEDIKEDKDSNSIGSANSLNESSSCSKITNSQCSFDSNQSVVGSSNTERDLEFRANESDVDIISNPSQSSIEVLDPNLQSASASRKTSEERRISQLPHLETINDDVTQPQSFLEREFGQTQAEADRTESEATTTVTQVGHVQLTESSSSGSVTDSICTAYEQQGKVKEEDKKSKEKHQTTGEGNIQLSEPAAVHPAINNNNNEPTISNGQLKMSMLGAIFQSTNILMSSSKKPIDAEANGSGSSSLTQPYKFNYNDFNDIDHRLKLYFYQHKFKMDGEHFKWLAKGLIYNGQTQTMREGLVVISTCRCYLMEAFAPLHDDVAKWLRQVVSVTVDRLTDLQVLPWKLGLAFTLKDWGEFSLLLQDMLRTDSLLLYLQGDKLPQECHFEHQPSTAIRDYLNSHQSEPFKICAILTSCQWTSGEEKRNFDLCTLLTTDTQLSIAGNGKFDWLSAGKQENHLPMDVSLSQPMSNLVEVERDTDEEYTISFIDDTQSKCETWHLKFGTQTDAECCLKTIGQSWERLFGVPFSYSGT